MRKKLATGTSPKQRKNQKLANANRIVTELEQYLPKTTVDFIRAQVVRSQRIKTGVRWSLQDKMLALSIFYHSRKAYKIVAGIFPMPSKRTLQRALQKCDIVPGFSEQLFTALKVKVQSMSEQDKQCVLVFDEMSLKSGLTYNLQSDSIEGFENLGTLGTSKYIANHALVFMVRGLATRWKQPVGYFLTSGTVSPTTLKALMMSCINQLASVGLTVRAIVCDQGANDRSMIKSMNVTPATPFFVNEGSKIFVFFYPPHLIKNTRNNFMKHGYLWNGTEILWRHVQNLYKFDSRNPVKMAPKLTHKHIYLPAFTAMRVKYATQVMSHTVASGISTLSTLGHLPPDASKIAKFIDKFDQLFNAFNSVSTSSSQQFRHAISSTTNHMDFLQNCIKFLNNISKPDKKLLPCLEGWQISVHVLIALWGELHSVCKFRFLLTSRLNQDCVENMFSIIRGKGGNRDNPDPQQFRAAFRQVAVSQLLKPSEVSNCQDDLDCILLNLNSMATRKADRAVASTLSNPLEYASDMSEMGDVVGVAQLNVISYMAGYILRKYPVDKCPDCHVMCVLSHQANEAEYTFLCEKAYCPQGCLVYPSPSFVQFIEQLELKFRNVFDCVMHMNGVIDKLCKHAELLSERAHCGRDQCVARTLLMTKLYMKVRIMHTLKVSNTVTERNGPGIKRNRKLLKLTHT